MKQKEVFFQYRVAGLLSLTTLVNINGIEFLKCLFSIKKRSKVDWSSSKSSQMVCFIENFILKNLHIGLAKEFQLAKVLRLIIDCK